MSPLATRRPRSGEPDLRLSATLRGLAVNEEQGLGLPPERVEEVITTYLAERARTRRPSTHYPDPTGDAACARAEGR